MQPHRQDPTTAELTAWVAGRVATYVQRPAGEIATDVPLTDYGLDSVSAVTLAAEIEDEWGLSLEPTIVWDHPTVDALSAAVAGEMAARRTAPAQ